MRNPLKSFRDRFGKSKKPVGPVPRTDINERSQKQLELIWPDGTWNMAFPGVKPNFAAMDAAARNWLVSVSEFEENEAWRAEHGDKLKWPTHPVIEPGWYPSRNGILGCAQLLRWEDDVVKYFIARLETLGHIKP